MSSTFDDIKKLWPRLGKYQKLVASLVTTTVPFIVYLLDPHSAKEIVEASGAYILVNLGVYGVPNES